MHRQTKGTKVDNKKISTDALHSEKLTIQNVNNENLAKKKKRRKNKKKNTIVGAVSACDKELNKVQEKEVIVPVIENLQDFHIEYKNQVTEGDQKKFETRDKKVSQPLEANTNITKENLLKSTKEEVRMENKNPDVSRDDIKAAREAKKLAKKNSKNKTSGISKIEKGPNLLEKAECKKDENIKKKLQLSEKDIDKKNKEEVISCRNIKKIENENPSEEKVDKLSMKKVIISEDVKSIQCQSELVKSEILNMEKKNKTTTTKAERRALQEAQRAAKLKLGTVQPVKQNNCSEIKKSDVNKLLEKKNKIMPSNITIVKDDLIVLKEKQHKVKLFNHLYGNIKNLNLFINHTTIHPAIVKLGEQYAQRTVVGSNARCIAFLNALKMVIRDYETPTKKEFGRSLESCIKDCVDHLHKCRPLAVSHINAYKYIKFSLTQLSTDQPESEQKENLYEIIDTYLRDQIEKAAEAISSFVQQKISNGDVILTFACSSLINRIIEEAHRRKIDFRVIIVDSRPFMEGQELLRRLISKGISCTYILINAVSFIMPEVTKVLLGAHTILANGYVMARTGTAQIALNAPASVPVLVCCETYKFSERVQTDAIVYNELGNPHDLVLKTNYFSNNLLSNWQTYPKICPLNLMYDVTPPQLITAFVTEVGILPCTSVPVILRIKPTEIGY